MQIINLYDGSYASNCYIAAEGNEAVIIDPSAKWSRISKYLEENGLSVSAVLLSHGHFDHILSLDEVRDWLHVPAFIHKEELTFPEDSDKNAYAYFFRDKCVWRRPEKTFEEGDVIPLGESGLTVLHTPGHTAGSSCFYCEEEKILFTGDTIFTGGNCGRTDLYSGNMEALLLSFKRLRRMPEDITIYPGHGDPGLLGDAMLPFSRL